MPVVCRRYAEGSKAILLCVFAPGEDDGRSTEVAVGAIAGRWKRRCGWAGSGDRVVEVVVRGTRTEGCEAGQFDMAGGTWSERYAHRSRQLLKREGVSSCHDYGGGWDGLRRCGGVNGDLVWLFSVVGRLWEQAHEMKRKGERACGKARERRMAKERK